MKRLALVVCALLFASVVLATETENLGLSILPVPGKVVIDGKSDDWDMTGGVFTCSDAENQHATFGTWFHAMYDEKNLYLLVRWLDDTPMNNPGSTKGDYGFAGDCLQFRTITAVGTPNERGAHWTAWRDRDGFDVIDVAWGVRFDGGNLRDAKTKGAQQAFQKSANGKGYAEELAIPWELLCKNGYVPKAGESMTITLEPNFTIGINGRWTMKDIFKPGITPDRVFTFMASSCWGQGVFEKANTITPRPVRLADGREFPVKYVKGGAEPLEVDWTGLIKVKELKGFKKITFTMPEDGYISLNLKAPDGTVARQLLTCAFYTKGKHSVLWDGLTTANWRTPGTPVSAGDYTWVAIWHKGIGLKLRGWAHNAGSAPWDASLTSNWGGDHGIPTGCATDGEKMYLGWSGAEAGKALVATDLKGNVQWKASRFGMSGAELVAVDNGIVYAQNWGGNLFQVDSKKGGFTVWAGSDNSPDLMIKTLWGEKKGSASASGLDARGGKILLTFTKDDAVMILDGKSGKLLHTFTVKAPAGGKFIDAGRAAIVSEGTSVVTLDVETGAVTPLVTGLANAKALAVAKDGRIFVGTDNQVRVFTADGKPVLTIGRPGGRALTGKWTSDGMAFINELAVDGDGKLWVMEADQYPKRVSVWDTKTGAPVTELFGPTTYGALGGAINPLDPNVMVGAGCEWKLDPKTGKADCVASFTRDGMENARFAVANGKLYVATATRWAFDLGSVNIFERLGPGEYKRLTRFFYVDKDNKEIPPPAHGQTGAAARTAMWCDENGDGLEQPAEITYRDGLIRMTGWYMYLTPDMTFYSDNKQYKVAGFTACGAPKYDLANPVKMPAGGLGSADGRLVMHQGSYGANNGWNECFDIATGKRLWTYPDNFIGVHGSHNAVPPENGMIRGSFGPCGTVKLPDPIGNAWVIGTNVGEWHVLTEDGYYLTRLFEPDPLKVKWPDQAVPGAAMDSVPCGMGGEDFGGSIAGTPDGKLFLQAGKTGFWNVEVTGLENVRAMKGGKVEISAPDLKTAQAFRESYLQEANGPRRLAVARLTPTFTGNLDTDFKGAEIVKYQKQDDAAARSSVACDEKTLYLAWDVKDNTPWMNSATDPTQMYIGGDTVDFQLATDPKADKNRGEGVLGDLRLSIGNFKGAPTAVIYRKVSAEKRRKLFSSGIVREYWMDYADVIADAQIKVTLRGKAGYVVEAAIPLAALGFTPAAGLNLRGDLGVTHGDPAGTRTRLRSFWANQHTGIVDDAVFELQMEPKNWGELLFK
jgi:hypothetical protein